MNKFIKILICMIISIGLQCSFLYYVDKHFFKKSEEITIKNVEITENVLRADITIPDNADDIKISDSGKYIIYYQDGVLMLANTKSAKIESILNDTEILDIRWVPNNNTLFIVEKNKDEIKAKTFNANNSMVQEIGKVCDYSKNSEVRAYISQAQEYIKVKTPKKTNIYRIDVNDEVNKISAKISDIGSAVAFWQEDVFVYQDVYDKEIFRYNNKVSKELQFNNNKNLSILCATEKKLYIGEFNKDKKICNIIHGEDGTDTATWQVLTLPEPKDANDIYVTGKEQVIVVDRVQKKVKNISTGKELSYNGEFVAINDKLVFSLDGGKVCFNSISDIE